MHGIRFGQTTAFFKHLQKKVDSDMQKPGRIWLKSWMMGSNIHFKVNDCENYEPCGGHITHIMYMSNSGKWAGTLRFNDSSFIMDERQSVAMFEGYFNWMDDFLWIFDRSV